MIITGLINFINISCGLGLILIHLFKSKRRRGYLQILSEDFVGEPVFKIDLFIRNISRICTFGFLISLTFLIVI